MSMRWDIAANAALVWVLPMLAAAAPPSNDFLKQPMMAEATVGPGSQAGPISRLYDPYTAAPMPDRDRDAPAAQAESTAPHVSAKLFHKRSTYHGEGYVFGSTVQEQQDRRVGPAPGINLIMPLQ